MHPSRFQPQPTKPRLLTLPGARTSIHSPHSRRRRGGSRVRPPGRAARATFFTFHGDKPAGSHASAGLLGLARPSVRLSAAAPCRHDSAAVGACMRAGCMRGMFRVRVVPTLGKDFDLTVSPSWQGRTGTAAICHAFCLLFPVVLPGPVQFTVSWLPFGLGSTDRAENLGRGALGPGASHTSPLPRRPSKQLCLPWFSRLNKLVVIVKRLFAAPACRGTEAAPPESDAEKDFDQGCVLATCWGPPFPDSSKMEEQINYVIRKHTPRLGRYLA